MLHHVFSVGGQAAAAAPIIVVAAILSHTAGLVAAGHFVIVAAAAAIIFTTAFFGFVYYVVVDRMHEFDAQDYVWTRLAATAAAVALLFAYAGLASVSLDIVLLVALLRAADAAVDLSWGFDLLRQPTETAMRRYALLNFAKLAAIVAPAPLFLVGGATPLAVLLASAAISAVGCWAWLAHLARGQRAARAGNQISRSARLVRRAIWFTLGASVCAAAVSAPRLLIDRLYVGETMGVVGVTLTFAAIYSMAFMSSWLRWFPRLTRTPENERRFSGMILESLAMGLAFLLFNVTIAPWLVSIVFGFDHHTYGQICRDVLLAATFFAFAMNMANLFKVTSAVWLESASYAAGMVGGAALLLAWSAAVPGFLLAAGSVMLATVAGGMFWIGRHRKSEGSISAIAGGRAVFMRLAGRPVPRVTRMMAVAREAGLEPVFVGAFRDEGVAAEDSWEGFPVRRVGKPFPLLNGTRPWLYLRSVFACNRGFFAALREMQPAVVHASDFETMPAAILYRLTRGCRLVYNIHDNLGQRYSAPTPVNFCLNAMEGVAVLFADEALVPERFRRGGLPRWCRHKVTVIRNLPPDDGSTPPPSGNGTIRLFYGGWLDWQRGLRALLELAKEPDIELRVAGEGAPEIVQALKQAPSVTYLGFLKSTEIIEETRRCHIVPVLYDPARTINRFAASNKLAEALSIGRPMILNEELEIARELAGADCVVSTKYAEAATIAPRLRAIVGDPAKYSAACANARQTYEAHYSWREVRTKSWRALTGRKPEYSH